MPWRQRFCQDTIFSINIIVGSNLKANSHHSINSNDRYYRLVKVIDPQIVCIVDGEVVC